MGHAATAPLATPLCSAIAIDHGWDLVQIGSPLLRATQALVLAGPEFMEWDSKGSPDRA